MKYVLSAFALALLFVTDLAAQTQYQVVTVVESIVPAGIGRSRIIEVTETKDAAAATAVRTDGKQDEIKNVKRKDLKVDEFKETKLLNFYSLGGINFQNIASNDALITDKLNQMAADGWELAFVTSGVEGDAGETDGNGIFITRFVFKK